MVVLASNLVWLLLSLVALVYASTRMRDRHAGGPRATMQALLATGVLAFVLLPSFSMSDDLLEAQQSALPASAQSWHLASAGATSGVDEAPILAVCLLLLLAAASGTEPVESPERRVSRSAVWLMRAQRLRPPPRYAL